MTHNILSERLRTSKTILWVLALISIVGGVLAMLNPFAASIAATVIAAWVFILFGLVQILHGFQIRDWSGFIWALLFGILSVLLGGFMLGNPLQAVMSLTILVAAMLLAAGITKIMYAWAYRPLANWTWIAISGVVSVILAIMIMSDFPQSAKAVLGIFLGIELLSNGLLYLFVAFGLGRLQNRISG